jgi:hypothetical protein
MEWSGRALYTASVRTLDGVTKVHRHVQQINSIVATMGIDIGKYSFHVVGLDPRGAIVLPQKRSRSQIEVRLANMLPCLTWRPASARIT